MIAQSVEPAVILEAYRIGSVEGGAPMRALTVTETRTLMRLGEALALGPGGMRLAMERWGYESRTLTEEVLFIAQAIQDCCAKGIPLVGTVSSA